MVLKNSKTACFSALNLYDRVVRFFPPHISVHARSRATSSYSLSVIGKGRLGLGVWITAVLSFIFQNPQRNTFCVLRDPTHVRAWGHGDILTLISSFGLRLDHGLTFWHRNLTFKF
jgi:hypothetical protein